MSGILDVFERGGKPGQRPVWMMRQAGRYLPEYRALRVQKGTFLDLVYDPVAACEVTMQPLRRFGFDAAILFSDILVVPHALGFEVRFEAGEGPRLQCIDRMDDIRFDQTQQAKVRWAPVIETVSAIRAQMNREGFLGQSLIGFAGAPWTIACYMVEGQGGDHQFQKATTRAQHDPDFFERLLDWIAETTILYLGDQIRAGAQIIQIFDSWAGACPAGKREDFILKPTQKIVTALKAEFPDVPVIGFPRALPDEEMARFVADAGVDAVQLGSSVSYPLVRSSLGSRCVTQGFLDPVVLRQGGDLLDHTVQKMIDDVGSDPHIFNLGHGILPDTPIAHVEQFLKRIRQ